jgi:hypothetical protein
VKDFLRKLLIFYLCLNFNESIVDGIPFEKIDFNDLKRTPVISNKLLKSQITEWWDMDIHDLIEEYMRLTNIAFNVDCDTPPVFIFDEVQVIDIPINENFNERTLLSALFEALSEKFIHLFMHSDSSWGNRRA